MNTKNQKTIFLRLNLLIFGFILGTLISKAATESNLSDISGYYKFTANEMYTSGMTFSKNAASITKGTVYGDVTNNYILVAGTDNLVDNKAHDGITFVNEETEAILYAFRTKKPSSALAFRLKEGMKAKIRIYYYNQSSSLRSISLRTGTAVGTDTLTLKRQGISKDYDILEYEVNGTELTTSSSSDTKKYFYIGGQPNPTYDKDGNYSEPGADIFFHALEIIPYVTSTNIDYSGDTDVTYSPTNTNIIDINKLIIKGPIDGAYDDNGNEIWPSVLPESGCSIVYGNNKELWKGKRNLTWNTEVKLKLDANFFTNFTGGEKITFTISPTEGASSSAIQIWDGNWNMIMKSEDNYSSNSFDFTISSSDSHTSTNEYSSDKGESKTSLAWAKAYGLIINANGCTITKITYDGDGTTWHNVNDGIISLNGNGTTFDFSNELTGVTVSSGDESDTDYRVLTGYNYYSPTTKVAYYIKGAAESTIPIFVSSSQESPYVLDPIVDYYKITADEMTATTGAYFGGTKDTHFYVQNNTNGKSSSYGATVDFANGVTENISAGYNTKFVNDRIVFKLRDNMKAQVRVYFTGAAGRALALREVPSSGDPTVYYKASAGSGKVSTLMQDVTGSTDKEFYITGYSDDQYLENNIYILGIEIIPWLGSPWVWYNNGRIAEGETEINKENTVYISIDENTPTPYNVEDYDETELTGFNPENVGFGGGISNGNSILTDTDNPIWINLTSGTTSDYQLDYTYVNLYEGTASNGFSIEEDGEIKLTEATITNGAASISYVLEGVHAGLTKDGGIPVAYYFNPGTSGIKDNPTKISLTVSLQDKLSITLEGPCYDNEFVFNYLTDPTDETSLTKDESTLYVYYDDKSSLPVPTVYFNGVNHTSDANITYTYKWMGNLEDTNLQEYTITLETGSTTTISLNNGSKDLVENQDIYKNSLFKVTYTISYTYTDSESNNQTVTSTNAYYLAIMCPNYTYAKIGSDAKLIVGSEDASKKTAWDSTDDLSKYDDFGVYYASIAWPIVYSWSMTQDMFSNYYSIEYEAYKTADKNISNHHVTGTHLNGGYKYNTRLQPKGQSGLTDGMEMTCDDNDERYLEVRVYAVGKHLNATSKDAQAKILVSKGLYKFILFNPPTISPADANGYVSKVPITVTPANSSATGYSKTMVTTDGSLPMNPAGDNVRETSNIPTATHTTVYYAADFITPTYTFYTGEGGISNSNEPFAVVSKKYMYIKNPGEIYSVQYDSKLIYRDENGDLILDSNDAVTYPDKNFAPNDEDLNNRIKNALKVPAEGYTSETSLHVMLGTQNVMHLNGDTFQVGGVQWNVSPDGGFDEYIDDFENPLFGNNWKPDKGTELLTNTSTDGLPSSTSTADGSTSYNANPYTECNGGIGGSYTQNGGMFLTPINGDFFRLEPEFDGVCTMWVRQNGATDNSTRTTGYMARRPVFIMDEDGVILRRSNIKPTVESYYCVDGTYAVISGRNTFRRDFEETWRYGLLNWNSTTLNASDNNVLSSKDKYRLYSNWFSSVKLKESSGEIDWENTEYVDRYDKMSPIIYRSEYMTDVYEPTGEKPSFAMYGYEMPNFSYVRYRIPMKAGKTYYLGGRGTKNGFVAVQFEGMPANYDPIDYVQMDENKQISTGSYAKYGEEESSATGSGKTDTYGESFISDGGKNRNVNFTPATIRGSYNTSDAYPMYHLYTETTTSHTAGDLTKVVDISSGTETEITCTFPTITKNTNSEEFPYYNGSRNVYPTIDLTLHRTFTKGKWHSIVLPFSVSETKMKELFGENVIVLYLDPQDNTKNGTSGLWISAINPAIGKDENGKTKDELRFTRHYYQMLYANTPAFVYVDDLADADENGNVYQIVFKRVTYRGSDVNTYDIGGDFTVTGTYAKTTKGSTTDDTDYGIYYLSNNTALNGDNYASVYHLAKGKTVDFLPTRAWIQPVVTTSSVAPTVLTSVGFNSYEGGQLEDTPETNSIFEVIADEVTIPGYADDTVYDMMGRVVAKGSTEGLSKGIYIYQGRKVVVK